MDGYIYQAGLEPDPDGGFLVSFNDVPEALTHGETRAEAIRHGAEALGLALRGYLTEGRELPQPKETEGVAIAVNPADAIKLAVITRFRECGISKSELARRIGKAEGEARRILDPDHPSKIGVMQDALQAMGQTIVVSVMKAA